MYPVSHKTIFMIDESPIFVGSSCNQAVEFDVPSKSRSGHPLPPLTKSLWTCAIEGVAEYCRIVWDIYPDGDRLISYVRTPPQGVVCTQKGGVLAWRQEEQSLPVLMNNLIWTSRESMVAKFTAIRKHDHGNLVAGFQDAIEAIGRPSDVQIKAMKKSGKIANRGRIVCISMFANDAQIMALQEKLSQLIDVYNETVAMVRSDKNEKGTDGKTNIGTDGKTNIGTDGKTIVGIDGKTIVGIDGKCDTSDNRLTIDTLDILFLNTVPLNDNSQSSKIVNIPNHQVSTNLTSEVTSSRSGTFLSQKLTSLVLKHYNLASTTVTGIPMKEEQNASSSANYDVEIFHPEEIHTELYVTGGAGESVRVPKEGVEYETLPLKWCTPRSTSGEMNHTTVSSRVTPVDVNSRPSCCLTNFLLSGRTVMLEMPRMKGSKFMSHMLASHKGELYIHTLSSTRSILEDPPSISEGVGGRVTDYRINDFGESVMKFNKLVPCQTSVQGQSSVGSVSGQSSVGSVSGQSGLTPSELAIRHLERSTVYWPIVLGHSIMYNIQGYIGSLLELVPKEKLTQEEVNECRNSLFQVVSMESKNVNLTVPGLVLSKGKGPKKEELYKMLYKELDHFITKHCTSPEHQLLLNCLHELHNGAGGGAASASSSSVGTSFDTSGSSCGVGKSEGLAWNQPLLPTTLTERSTTPNSVLTSGSVTTGNEATGNEATGNEASDPAIVMKRSLPGSVNVTFENPFANGTESLLSFWTKKLKYEENKRHPNDFAGRSNGLSIAPLYPHLTEKNGNTATSSDSPGLSVIQ